MDSSPDEVKWRAVLARDASQDGIFYYAVETTGIYCRPSCSARRPKREHVTFFADSAQARGAGYRACARCTPDGLSLAQRRAERVATLCRMLEGELEPSLAELAEAAGWSSSYTHRIFKEVTGMTPKNYAQAKRAQALRDGLARAGSVTEAIVEAGYGSSSRVYDKTDTLLGMPPSTFRDRGRAETIRFAVGRCSLGEVLVAATELGVCAILLGDDPQALIDDLGERFSRAEIVGADAAFEDWVAHVIGLIEAPQHGLDLPLDVQGTLFQRRVWQALQAIEVGSTSSYAEIARAIGKPSASRAVAQACGANPLAVAIPCHRVVRSDGELSGYRWGIERKRELLARERDES